MSPDHRPSVRPALTDRVQRNRETLSAEVDEEVVALDVARGACYGLDSISARIWGMIAEPVAISEVCEALMEIYQVDPDQCRREVLDLFAEMTAEGLVVIEPCGSSSAP